MTTERAQKIWEAFKAELIVQPTDDMREALSTAIRECADRLCTDWAELEHPSTTLAIIADELDTLETDH